MDQQQIYAHHAAEYDALVAAEDCDRHLLPALEAIVPLAGASALDVGAGTGRVTRLLAARAARVVGVDRAAAMLDVARAHLVAQAPPAAWELHCADARALPVASASADVAVAGWVFGHLRYWMPEGWQAEIGAALAEMERALVPGGTLIIIETLGTGHEEPRPPSPELAEYYAWLEAAHGLTRTAIRTDYLFPDVATAATVTGFFFGEAFAARVRREAWQRIPECTGLWWKRRPA
jgi:ubiquinone/menaquinone biosynthesis C-methylase UbiE